MSRGFDRCRASHWPASRPCRRSPSLLAFASTNIRLQTTVADSHAAAGHYAFMAAFGFTVVAVALLASLRPDGWRLTAWVAGEPPISGRERLSATPV